MSDDFAVTTLDREAMTFDEPLVEPTPAVATVDQDPAWAGALGEAPPGVPATPTPPLASEATPPPAERPPAAPSPAAPPPPVDPADFAATSLHQRAYDLSVEPPLDELSEHNRILAALPERAPGAPPPSEAGDRLLMVGLVVVGAFIALIVVALLCAGGGALLGPE